MIFKRAVARLRAQDWLAITIELAIVIIGVFIGIWVANWNQERLERNETRQTLLQLEPELAQLEAAMDETPRGALVVAGIAVGLLILCWLIIYVFVFLPRGTVG